MVADPFSGVEAGIAALEARLAALDEQTDAPAPLWTTPPASPCVQIVRPAPTVPGWAIGTLPGLVVDAGLARSTPCTRIGLGAGQHIIFSPGIVGALDEEQEALYCAEGYEEKAGPPLLAENLRSLGDLSAACLDDTAEVEDPRERTIAYFACLAERIEGPKGVKGERGIGK